MEFSMVDRQPLVVWLYSAKDVNPLKKHGYIYYISQRMRYLIMYVPQEQVDQIMTEIKKYHFVREVEASPTEAIDLSFEHVFDEWHDQERVVGTVDHSPSFFEDIAASIRHDRPVEDD